MVNTRRSTPTVTDVNTSAVVPPTTDVTPATGQGSTPLGEGSQVLPPQPQETNLQGTEAETLGSLPPIVSPHGQGTSSLQMVIAPLSGQPIPPNAQISTTVLPVSTNPVYGLPNYPPPPGHEPYDPPYIRGLVPLYNQEYRDYSGPYTDDSSSDRDEAPRRRRVSREPRRHTQRIRDGTTMTAMERIQAFEAEIQKLKGDIAREQQARQERPRVDIPLVNLETPRIQSRVEVPKTIAPKAKGTRLGHPGNPNPPFTEEVMRAHISRKFRMPAIKAYDGRGDPTIHGVPSDPGRDSTTLVQSASSKLD